MRGVQHRTGCSQPAPWVSTNTVDRAVVHTCPECGRSAYHDPDREPETADEGWWEQ